MQEIECRKPGVLPEDQPTTLTPPPRSSSSSSSSFTLPRETSSSTVVGCIPTPQPPVPDVPASQPASKPSAAAPPSLSEKKMALATIASNLEAFMRKGKRRNVSTAEVNEQFWSWGGHHNRGIKLRDVVEAAP